MNFNDIMILQSKLNIKEQRCSLKDAFYRLWISQMQFYKLQKFTIVSALLTKNKQIGKQVADLWAKLYLKHQADVEWKMREL